MATFILIHGAWHGGWCFDKVAELLEARGHKVIAPDLPGMERDREVSDEELAAVSLDGWAGFAADLCRSAPEKPVILCGHSRAGIVISQAAEKAPEAIDALVYICAMLIPSGMSRAELKARQKPNPAFDAIRLPHPSMAATVVDNAGNAVEVFAQMSPPDLAHDAISRLKPEPSAPTGTLLNLTEERFGSVPRHYIECLHDRTILIEDQRLMQSLQPCQTVTTLETDHSPFLSMPHELANALLQIVDSASE
ncbi:alpha/beta fold hydrolase [Emcibacter sp.]|uniref:alpha/beta fold hydrolase n=1 Tax=Emcibacter sp. TaxID=1979954 RepID=UPI002AA739A6|nr:alpha/beta fold hydrolase [Emcibacter sp.]